MCTQSLEVGRIVAMVEFTLDSAAMKGRQGLPTGIRPNHWMPGRDYTFMGQLDFVDREWLKPGETCVAKGSFIIAKQDLGSFVPGLTWQVGEGIRIIGRCTLLSVEEPYEQLPTLEELRTNSPPLDR
jgi:hypothetical protein